MKTIAMKKSLIEKLFDKVSFEKHLDERNLYTNLWTLKGRHDHAPMTEVSLSTWIYISKPKFVRL